MLVLFQLLMPTNIKLFFIIHHRLAITMKLLSSFYGIIFIECSLLVYRLQFVAELS